MSPEALEPLRMEELSGEDWSRLPHAYSGRADRPKGFAGARDRKVAQNQAHGGAACRVPAPDYRAAFRESARVAEKIVDGLKSIGEKINRPLTKWYS